VIWFYSIHQPPSLSLGKSAMAPAFQWPLLAATLGFTLLFAAIVLMRMRALLAAAKAEARMRRKAAA
jgi:heme exporter protein C